MALVNALTETESNHNALNRREFIHTAMTGAALAAANIRIF